MYALISESQSSAVLGGDFNNKKLARSCFLLGLCTWTEYRTLLSLLDWYLFDSLTTNSRRGTSGWHCKAMGTCKNEDIEDSNKSLLTENFQLMTGRELLLLISAPAMELPVRGQPWLRSGRFKLEEHSVQKHGLHSLTLLYLKTFFHLTDLLAVVLLE